MKNLLFFCLFTFLFLFSCATKNEKSSQEYQSIKKEFITPSLNNELWCYYYWINDDISKEGITKDLEAMKRVGISTVLIGNINPDGKDGKVPLFSDEWWDLTVHTVNEGKRVGVDVGFFNSPGWSQSGGPWVEHDKAMRYIIWNELIVEGGKKIEVKIDKPADEFQDVKVLAIPEKSYKSNYNTPFKVHYRPEVKNFQYLVDNDTSTAVLFDSKEKEYEVDIVFGELINAKSLLLYPAKPTIYCKVSLFAVNNDKEVLIDSFEVNRSSNRNIVGPNTHGPIAVSFKEVSSTNFFRLKFSEIADKANWASERSFVGFSEILISEEPMVERYVEKSLAKMYTHHQPDWYSYRWDLQEEEEDVVNAEDVIDISGKMDLDGKIKWDAPEGKWRIIRFGMTPTGVHNHPSAPQGRGYEIDKMSNEIARYHFENFVGEIYRRVPEESRSALKYVIADSYETGSQNWTDDFALRFEDKFGYNPEKYLPVYLGKIVESVEKSDRFLNDMRRIVADDIAHHYVGGLKKVANEYGLKLWLENYGHWGFPSEFLLYGGQTDLMGGEFWTYKYEEGIECIAAASAAHIYGKQKVFAESYTSGNQSYLRHPATLKKYGDWSYTTGVNAVVLHVYIQQPDDDRVPGVNAWFGTEFNRHNTWFELSKYWNDYQRRCQHMLQQGNNVADACYFIGENAPVMTGVRQPELPAGYKFDYINADVIMNRLDVEEGKFVLPEGISYEIMVLPPAQDMTPELLTQIEKLVSKGGRVLGPKPLKSPSLKNYPTCDDEVKFLADKLWGDKYSIGQLNKPYGKGSLFNEMTVDEVFAQLNVEKDVEINTDHEVLWIHRSIPGMEIYFLSNQTDNEIELSPSFRVSGLRPQLWDAVSGEILQLSEYQEKDGRTSVKLKMEPAQSWFIVFTNEGEKDLLPEKNFNETTKVLEINSAWNIDFEDQLRGPKETIKTEELFDWSSADKEELKYYSGTATYTTSFNIESVPEGNVYVNIGKVHELAEIKLNGKTLGGVWMAPYALPVGDNLKQGENILEITVANLWRNRMMYEKLLAEKEKTLWWLIDDIKEDEALHPSGMLGPVFLEK